MIQSELENKLSLTINGISEIKHPKGWHAVMINTDIDIWYIIKGKVEIIIENKSYILTKGETFLIAPNKEFVTNVLENGTHYVYCHFDLYANISEKSMYQYISSSFISLKNSGIVKALKAHHEREPFYLLEIRCCMLKIMRQYFLENESVIKEYLYSSVRVNHINQILSYIEKNIHNKISNETLAELGGFSEKYLIVYFKKVMGVTPSEYIKKLKMSKALEYLSIEKLSVNDVAQKLGFYDQFAFSKAFKKYYGISPMALKKSM